MREEELKGPCRVFLVLVSLMLGILDQATENQVFRESVYQIVTGYKIPDLEIKSTRIGSDKEKEMTRLR
jgi:hypothetical protein